MSLRKTGDWNIDKMIKMFKSARSSMPKRIANDAKNHFLEGFRQGGGQTDKGKWIPRGKKSKQSSRAILVLKGRLRKSIKVTAATFEKITIASVGVSYAERHNEGLDGMPQREFLGKSTVLDAKVKATITKEIKKVFA